MTFVGSNTSNLQNYNVIDVLCMVTVPGNAV
jgi:hypothetical protein